MKKIFIGITIGFILGISSSVIATTIYNAVDIKYTNENTSATNVEEALDDIINNKQAKINLYETNGTATSDKILSGYNAYVKGSLITGTYDPTLTYIGELKVGGGFSSTTEYQNSVSLAPGHYMLIYNVSGSSNNAGWNSYPDSLNTNGVCTLTSYTTNGYDGSSHSHYADTSVFDCNVTTQTSIVVTISRGPESGGWTTYSASGHLNIYKYK